MGKLEKVSINYGPSMEEFAKAVIKEYIKSTAETGEYKNIHYHPEQDHHGGRHEQVDLKIEDPATGKEMLIRQRIFKE